MSFKDKHELETLEKEIASLERNKGDLEIKLSQTTNYEELNGIGAVLKTINDELDLKSIRWLELQERISN